MNEELKAWLGGIAVLIFGGTYGHMLLRRIIRTSTDISKDRTESDLLSRQQIRIQDLEKMLSDQTEKYFQAVRDAGVLEGEVRALTMKAQTQEMEIKELRSIIDKMQVQINSLMERANP